MPRNTGEKIKTPGVMERKTSTRGTSENLRKSGNRFLEAAETYLPAASFIYEFFMFLCGKNKAYYASLVARVKAWQNFF